MITIGEPEYIKEGVLLKVVKGVEQTTFHSREEIEKRKLAAESAKAAASAEILSADLLLAQCDNLGL